MIALSLACGPLLAQQREAPPLHEILLLDSGTRVRVHAALPGSTPVAGPLVSADGGVLTLIPDGHEEPIGLPLSRIERLEVSRGHSRNTLRGLGLGFVVGALPGLILGIAARGGEDNPLNNHSAVVVAAGGALAVGTLGGLIGMTIGATSKTERWRLLDWPEPPSAELRTAPEVRLGVTLTF